MPRPAPGDHEQSVDPNIVAVAHVARREPLGRDRDAFQPMAVERERRVRVAGARLDLDKGEGAAAAGDYVDFASRDPRPAREDAPAVEPQEPAGEGFGAAPASLSFAAGHLRDSSSARA